MKSHTNTTNTVLITGGSLGIGFALAKNFAANGFRLILVAKLEDELAVAKEKLEKEYKTEVFTLTKDLTAEGAAESVYQWTKSLPYPIDVLVNNAGFGTGGYILDIPIARELNMIDLNIKALYHLTRLFLQDMVAHDSGKILNVASIAAFQPSPMLTTYSATKSFVFSFTTGLNHELKAKGSKVRLTALCPPPAKTGFQAAADLAGSPLFESSYVVTAEQIAARGYRALMQDRIFVIPDTYTDILTELGNRLLPLWLKLKVTYNVMTKGKMF